MRVDESVQYFDSCWRDGGTESWIRTSKRGKLTLTSASRFSAATGMAVAEVARLRAAKKMVEKRMVGVD
jgi:hypothetical protein